MYITPNMANRSFGRALTTQESIAYNKLLDASKKQLGIQDTCAIVFDFNVPSDKNRNTAIGSSFSNSMGNFTRFLKKMTGITSVQMQPQGKISLLNTSAYSGTNFAFGEHIIDLGKLCEESYGCILSSEYVENLDKNYNGNKHQREYKTDYSYVLGDEDNGIQRKALRLAFNNYKKGVAENLPEIVKLEEEFSQFKKDNAFWLEKDALFEALSKHYKTSDFRCWSDVDRDLFSKKCSEELRQDRISQIKSQYADEIAFEEFVQFLADKQQKETRIFLTSENINLYGDCLIGFSQSEMWANKDCFRENLYYGGPDPNCPETNNIQIWGLPALDYTKLGECSSDGDLSELGEVGKFLYDKYTAFFKRYDGLRMDAAWQFVTPFIYQVVNGNYEEFKLPEIKFTILNIMNAAAKAVLGDKYDEENPDNIILELVGISADRGRELTINKYPHLYTTAYAEYDESPAKFIEKGYKDGKFYAGTGNHDNDSLVNMAKDTYKRELHLNGIKRDYRLDINSLGFDDIGYQSQNDEEKYQENFRTAKLAEVFTSFKQFFTLPDMFGMSERINISGKTSKANWTVRIPSDYERFYFSQLSNGYGLNMPKVLLNAMKMKGADSDKYLFDKCKEAAEILRQKGPLTEEEANIAAAKGEIKHQFEFSA